MLKRVLQINIHLYFKFEKHIAPLSPFISWDINSRKYLAHRHNKAGFTRKTKCDVKYNMQLSLNPMLLSKINL